MRAVALGGAASVARALLVLAAEHPIAARAVVRDPLDDCCPSSP